MEKKKKRCLTLTGLFNCYAAQNKDRVHGPSAYLACAYAAPKRNVWQTVLCLVVHDNKIKNINDLELYTTVERQLCVLRNHRVAHEAAVSTQSHLTSPLTMLLKCLVLLVALASFVTADVEFTGPAAGSTITGTTLSITWKESGTSPPISELASYQIFLCAGGNSATDYIPISTLVSTGNFAKGNSVTASFTIGLGAPTANAYFLKMISAATGGVVINYSDRFTLASMDGTFPPVVTAGLKTVTGTAGPPTENDIQAPQVGATGTIAAGAAQFGTPYTLQTGQIRFAPMPPMAQTKITAKNASPQFPTSAYTVYATIAGSPNAISTQTAPETFSTVSRENTVSQMFDGLSCET